MENLGPCSHCGANPRTPKARRQIIYVDQRDGKVTVETCPTCRPDDHRDQQDRLKRQRRPRPESVWRPRNDDQGVLL